MEQTLVILKPRLGHGRCWNPGEITYMMERALSSYQAEMTWMRTIRLTPQMVKKIYCHVMHLPFYQDMELLYTGHDSYIQIWTGPQIIKDMRNLVGSTIGPTHGTLRFKFASKTVTYDNAIHCSDSQKSFEAEYDIIRQSKRAVNNPHQSIIAHI
jgi:nucleoside diphosphate kinase